MVVTIVTTATTLINIAVLTWDGVSWISQLALVVFAGVALISGTIVNKRQAKQLLELQTKLSETTEKASKAQESAAKTEIESDKLKIIVAAAEEKRAKAERELLELQERLAARTVSPEQRARFISRLEYQPKGKVTFSALVAPNGEPRKFAEILKGLLADAGYDVSSEITAFVSTGNPVNGILIKVKDGTSPPRHAGVIQKALEAIEIKAPATVESASLPLDSDTVAIYVYWKD
jgi:hypothetical protein